MTMTPADEIQKNHERFVSDFQILEKEISKRIVGQRRLLRETLVTIVAGGHLLLEGVPGLGKTLLVRTIAEAVDCSFTRIQFTPDLVPADLIGTEMVVRRDSVPTFEFRKGPIFTQILLADEINRATPKTQSALLEAMEEKTVTVGGIRYPLGDLFFVMATQNPIELEGTYPLPEAQLDRFFSKLSVPYPTVSELNKILENTSDAGQIQISPVMPASRLKEMKQFARAVPVAPSLLEQISVLISSTWPRSPHSTDSVRKYLKYGASPRGARALLSAAKIFALLDGRYNVSQKDITLAAPMVLRHRILLNYEGLAASMTSETLIESLLERV